MKILIIVLLTLTTLCCLLGSCNTFNNNENFQVKDNDDDYENNLIKDDIANGNPVSWSGIRNDIPLPKSHKPIFKPWNPQMQSPTQTYQGFGIPLKSNEFQTQHIMEIPTLSGMNVKCSIHCCPSQYTCDKGCLCI